MNGEINLYFIDRNKLGCVPFIGIVEVLKGFRKTESENTEKRHFHSQNAKGDLSKEQVHEKVER